MATLVTRSGKGSPLTHAEVDANFTNLNTDKLELSGGTMTGNLSFGDNDKAIFGAGSDLQIYHDPANGSIVKDNGVGRLLLDSENGTGISLTSGGIAKTMISATKDSDVTLYYNNSQKLATTSTGIDVTGTVTADGLTVDGATSLNASITQTSVSPSFYIMDSNTTDLNDRFVNAGGTFFLQTVNDAKSTFKSRFSVNNSTGDISFYEDTGTTAKFFWDASAESLGIGTTSPAIAAGGGNPELTISGTVSYFNLQGNRTAGAGNTTGQITSFNNSTAISRLATVLDSGTTDGAMLFSTASSGSLAERMRIDSSGNVLIKTASHTPTDTELVVSSEYSASGTTDAGITLSSRQSGNWRNSGIFANGDALTFTTGDVGTNGAISTSERMRIDSSGNVGIGTSTPNNYSANHKSITLNAPTTPLIDLEVNGTRTGSFVADSTKVDLNAVTSVPIRFLTADTERMRIDSSGNVGIGTSSPSTNFEIVGSVANRARLQTTSTECNLQFWNDATPSFAASIGTGNPTSNLSGTDGLKFDIYNGSSWSERMRIDSSGNVGIGIIPSSSAAGPQFSVENTNNTSGDAGIYSYLGSNCSNTSSVAFSALITGVGNKFYVYGNGNVVNTNNSYGAISDVKLKENIVDAASQWDDIKALTVRKYSMKADNLDAPNMLGVIAQEVEAAGMHGLVFESPDIDPDTRENLGTVTKQVNYSILYMKAVKALQEAIDRIETLEAKVNALENA